ncbi:DNA cytosine methyltransferase [Picosynechococcus sp. PCC 11901]|uniref:DNA cytosine methyltransferase n=1 Tax=Picosynechococcus sp. PCC 11901 TaxID=2579791 RepID=UPI0010FC1A0C|nr:DNA cytosine methyltransferase [Picosynechococcus sp. PCC 11901]QCS48280.1 DNA cytosine methyltransferase [Picosynechococcus sp. PCC 11901]
MSDLKLFSFFSGAGFLDLGFELNGFDVVHVNEIQSSFLEGYQYSRQKLGIKKPLFNYSMCNIEDFSHGEKSLELWHSVDLLKNQSNVVGFIGGPPCPDFSIGGKNRGRQGDHGKLSESYIDLIIQHQPDFFIFENVKGLYRTKKHRIFFEYLKQKLRTNNYLITENLLNSLEYAVPQQRERIFLIGFRKKLLESKFNSTHLNLEDCLTLYFPWKKYAKYSLQQIVSYPWKTTEEFVEKSIRPCPNGIPEELTVNYWFKKNEVETHPNASYYFKPRAGLPKFKIIKEGDDSKKSYKRLHRWRYSPTACYGNNEVHLHPYLARRISVAEALAIQSLPKDFQLPGTMSLTAMFKTIGNGVPFLLSESLAKSIYDFLKFDNKIINHQVNSHNHQLVLF